MLILDDGATAVAYTPADLSDAISVDNGVDYVYLGGNIVMTAGIPVNAAKTSLVIDGCYPPGSENFFTLTDSGSDAGQIYVNSSQNLDLTFQNLIISGRNFYGMPRVYDYTGSENVTVTYQNVTYNGPQTIYHVRGLARYIDCDVTIMDNGYSSAQEVAQINRVEIGGETVMRKSNTSDAIFWFYGSSTRKPYLKILSGANAEITTAYYFMYESYSPDYIIEPEASFTLHTGSGISWNASHSVSSFLVGENASFYFTQTSNRGYATIYLDGALTVSEGASFYMQTDFGNNYPIIYFAGSSAELNILNPKSFVLYNSGTAAGSCALSFYSSAANTSYTITGGQLNYWSVARAFPIAGTFADVPQYKWHKPQWEIFTISGAAGNSSTIISNTPFTDEELANLPPLSNLQLRGARVLSVGNLPLEVNTVVVGAPITGVTEPMALVDAEYVSEGTGYSSEVAADADGAFYMVVTPQVPSAAQVTVSGNTPFLITKIITSAQEEGELSIVEAPEYIRFRGRPMTEFPDDLILPRQITDVPVIVSDTRADKTDWQLWARITGPLTTTDGDVLNNAVVFILEDGSIEVLDGEYVPIYTGIPFPETEKRVFWDADKGVLVRVTAPVRSSKEYSTQLDWEIRPLES